MKKNSYGSPPQEQIFVRLDNYGHVEHSSKSHGSQINHFQISTPISLKEEKDGRRMEKSSGGRSKKALGSRVRLGNQIHHLVDQFGDGEEVEREVEDVYQFHRVKQSMSQGFLDAYLGYNQILVYAPNKANTTFITDQANYCYEVMSFGLKNVGTTYLRLMNIIFCDQIFRSMDVYVNDMVVKS